MGLRELNVDLTKDHVALWDSTKKFVKEVWRPAAIELDKLQNPEDVIREDSPLWDVMRQSFELGYHSMFFPEEFGGMEMDPLSVALVAELQGWAAPDLAIPDDNAAGVTSTIAVSRPGVIGSVKVGVHIAHTYIGDLRVVLTAPDNTRIVLHNRTGASTDDLVQTYDVHSTPDLAQFCGKPANGKWKLTVSDHAGVDVGKLRRWNLAIQLASAQQLKQENQPAVAIPDNDPAGVSDSMAITASGDIKEVQVRVDITHTWIGDLQVKLTTPAGTDIILHDRSGGGQDNLIKTYSADNLAAIKSVVGQPAQGTWTLGVTDLAGRDVGKLNRWGLELTL